MAQLVEQFTRNEQVVGSSPTISSIRTITQCYCSFFIGLEPTKSTPNSIFLNLEKTVRWTVLQCVALPCKSDYQLQKRGYHSDNLFLISVWIVCLF